MIKLEHTEVVGWEHAIRGMRNPMNSWHLSDSGISLDDGMYYVNDKDFDLMKRLRDAGTDHRKFMRMIVVYADITAPLYWWKEFDTYKVGTVANSCSTMHKIHSKEFTFDDFSHDNLFSISPLCDSMLLLNRIIEHLNFWRKRYNESDEDRTDYFKFNGYSEVLTKKECWWQMIQLLPTSYNQKRTVMLNYEVLANMYHSRKNHKLDEWHDLCDWIKTLPYSELITGEHNE